MGEVGFFSFIDRSGTMTGYTYAESQRTYDVVFQGRRFWDCYDTTYEFDPMASGVRYQVKRPTREIVMGGTQPTVWGQPQGAMGQQDYDYNYNCNHSPHTPYIRDKWVDPVRENALVAVVAQALHLLLTMLSRCRSFASERPVAVVSSPESVETAEGSPHGHTGTNATRIDLTFGAQIAKATWTSAQAPAAQRFDTI